jgi:alkylation response protein AidB-like acyl-CoA dehydrogenase
MISFEPTDDQAMIRELVREFATSELRRHARASDEASSTPQELLDASWQLGLVNGMLPEAYGGGGLDRSSITSALVIEELGYGCASLGTAIMTPALFALPMLDFGTDAQKEHYLPLFAGELYYAASLALQEPHFSFDPAAMKTTAERNGAGWTIQGEKRGVPMGDRASQFLVIARAGEPGLRNLAAFIVARETPGLTIEPEVEKNLGFQSLTQTTLTLEGVELPPEACLGAEPGASGSSGFDGARLINCLRVGGAALAVGVCRAVTELAIDYAKERVAFGSPIAQKQAIAFMLAEMYSEVDTMRWMVWKAASQLEQGLDATRAATLADDYVSRKAMRIADNGVQVLGGHGYIRDYPMEMWFRNTRALTVIEGPVAA